MFYFYVFKSEKDGNLYWGSTNNLRKRFLEHNKGCVPSTKNRKPFSLVYYEAYRSEADAREREKQIKRRARTFISLKGRIKKSIYNFE